MMDDVLGLHNACPKCGSKRGLYYTMQYPLIVDVDMRGKPFYRDFKTNKRKFRLSNREKGGFFRSAISDEYQVATCICEKCGWKSEPYVP